MRIDPVKQFAKLQQQLVTEKARLEARLSEINEALGAEHTAPKAGPVSTPAPAAPAAPAKRRRGARNKLSAREYITQALSDRGPLSRSELGEAVRGLGYQSKAKDPLGSLGVVLYAKNSPFKRKNGKFYLAGGKAPVESSDNNSNGKARSQPGKKRNLSPEGRARIAAAAKARWARQRAGK